MEVPISRQELVKRASWANDAANAVDQMANTQLRADAFKDVRNVGLAALGVGLAGRGAVGLYNVIARNKQKKRKAGPALLPLPFPAKEAGVFDFLSGDNASTKSGIPWYGPAMLGVGLGGLTAGWKGMDAVLNQRRHAEQQSELEKARQDFHDALLSSYDKPLTSPSFKKEKKSADETMKRAGDALDALWGKCEEVLTKEAVDWANLGGQAAGMYGTYAGLSGLLTGALVYNQMRKRSRKAVLDKAVQKRERRNFMQSPTEIYATPEPVPAGEGG